MAGGLLGVCSPPLAAGGSGGVVEDSLEVPPGGGLGEEVIPAPAEVNYVPREVRTPVPVSAEVVASGEGRAAVVEGLPVSVRLAPVLLVDGEPVDGAQPPVDPVSVRVESFAAESVAEMGGEILAFGV